MKILVTAIALILLTGCVAIYGPGKKEHSICSKPNCYAQMNGHIIASSSSDDPISNGFVKFGTSKTTKSETIARIGIPDKKILTESGSETWLYIKGKSLHMYLVSALIIPIPVPLPYRDSYYYIFKFNRDTLEYFGYEEDTFTPIGPCYLLFWGKC